MSVTGSVVSVCYSCYRAAILYERSRWLDLVARLLSQRSLFSRALVWLGWWCKDGLAGACCKQGSGTKWL